MLKWIIFYAALTGYKDDPQGEILFFQEDSLKMFGTVWKINEMDHIHEYGDKLYRGHFRITYKDTVKAILHVEGMDILIHIEGEPVVVVTARQIPHYAYLYEDAGIEDEYDILQKTTNEDKPEKQRSNARRTTRKN